MRFATITAVAVLLLPLAGRGAAPLAPSPPWAKQAAKAGLDATDVERLGKNKILVGLRSSRQTFDFYLGGDLPAFITTDSLLNGYHVLYEESILRLESTQAGRLPKLLRELWDALKRNGLRLDGKAELASAARQRARIVVGVALALVGDKAASDDRIIGPIIEEETKRVTAARGQSKPKWLGPADAGFVPLDYSRYSPRGFYTRNEKLQRHFLAVSWLQSIPFRIGRDEELLAALILGAAVNRDEKQAEKWHSVCRGYQDFIGTGDDWDLLVMTKAADGIGKDARLDLSGKDLEKIRATLKKQAAGKGRPAINDQLAFAPDDPRQAAEVGFRVLSAYRLPDAVLFARTTDPKKFQRPFPEGLEVCAMLGSSFAAERIGGKDAPDVRKVIGDSKGLLSGKSLYNDYLKCLEALLAPAEKDAPALFRSEAWQAKSCQTALGGWAQMRHTWALQAKQNVLYLSSFSSPAGFVEPNPEFYARLGELARRSAELLDEQGPLGPDLLGLAQKLRLASRVDPEKRDKASGEELNAWGEMYGLGVERADVNRLADQLERGELPADKKLRKTIEHAGLDLVSLWKQLAGLCDRLELLAHKQLRGAAFNARDEAFVRGYGKELAAIMLYQGNSYAVPRDDAPRVVDVFTNPLGKSGQHLEVGIGRPREFYVLYPHRGREILCRGAVLPYHEFAHSRRLDDAGWKQLLDSRDAPASPAWVRPILSTRAVVAPRKD